MSAAIFGVIKMWEFSYYFIYGEVERFKINIWEVKSTEVVLSHTVDLYSFVSPNIFYSVPVEKEKLIREFRYICR